MIHSSLGFLFYFSLFVTSSFSIVFLGLTDAYYYKGNPRSVPTTTKETQELSFRSYYYKGNPRTLVPFLLLQRKPSFRSYYYKGNPRTLVPFLLLQRKPSFRSYYYKGNPRTLVPFFHILFKLRHEVTNAINSEPDFSRLYLFQTNETKELYYSS